MVRSWTHLFCSRSSYTVTVLIITVSFWSSVIETLIGLQSPPPASAVLQMALSHPVRVILHHLWAAVSGDWRTGRRFPYSSTSSQLDRAGQLGRPGRGSPRGSRRADHWSVADRRIVGEKLTTGLTRWSVELDVQAGSWGRPRRVFVVEWAVSSKNDKRLFSKEQRLNICRRTEIGQNEARSK